MSIANFIQKQAIAYADKILKQTTVFSRKPLRNRRATERRFFMRPEPVERRRMAFCPHPSEGKIRNDWIAFRKLAMSDVLAGEPAAGASALLDVKRTAAAASAQSVAL